MSKSIMYLSWRREEGTEHIYCLQCLYFMIPKHYELPICYTSSSVGRQEGVVELVTYTGVPVRCRDKVLDLNRASDAGHQVPDIYSGIF